MPVHTNLLAGGLHNLFNDESNQSERSRRGGVSGGIANHNGSCATVDGGRIKTFHHLWIATGSVLGHVHGIEAERHRELHRFFGGAQEMFDCPVFDEPPDRARTQESRGFDDPPGS